MSADRDPTRRIKRVVAGYPDAPDGIEHFTWQAVPRYWDRLVVPVIGSRRVVIRPRHEDRHAGIRFRVGWDEGERVVALWIL